ncbi:cytoplasmic FMR1-interacting protein-like [Physella acuta]|uniref:cytoplasmic FMR1-interacting protein-like n=1 Tax=Physella acuta TaxID=109671 RepID=UPI0027DDFB73|nr:cytoplasmic FMR1-interacting protein-like [Physella acuta]XP_059150473.1 cytoplasmic FMR1-interacting protein-like [Physella acuta]XP_059150482.1 cytoplasmic FMR1-interacting protein-like [Physella acuta]XP_059150491.1 cytoplasmic FMR1-interacting protein-like [Physella acuta]
MSGETTTLKDALQKVEELGEVHLRDQQPCIEAVSLSIQYRANFDTNFEDKNAFVTSVAKYKEQATLQADLNLLLEEGEEYAIMLYTWRCCSRGIPLSEVKSNSQENRKEIYEHTVEVLEPYILKLRKFLNFQVKAIQLFCDEIKRLSNKGAKNDFVSEAYLLTLGKLLNMFAVLNELINMKSSVNNDFAVYKRAAQLVNPDQNEMQEFGILSLSLATQNKIRDTLKSSLSQIQGYEEILADVVNICLNMYEKDLYLEPSEKHMLVKVIAFGLFMMNLETGPNIYRMNEKKKINLSRIDKVLKQLEMVPLYGDMMVAPYGYIKNGPHFDPSKWPACESSQPSLQSNILAGLDTVRESHMKYISQISKYSNETASMVPDSLRRNEENKTLTDLALRGLTLLSKWTQHIVELYSWKLMNPTDPAVNKNCPEEAEGYEKATRYNYSSDEKVAMVEIIAMIKGLQLLMSRMEPIFVDAIRYHIYTELQEFIQVFLREPLRKATKNKKDITRAIILAVRETCVDWLDGAEPKNDPALSGKKDPPNGTSIKINHRNIGPSSTMLYMVRTMLESLIDEKSGGKKNLRKEHIAAIEEFHRKSFFWHYLLNFNESLFNCGDLSQLWYREFFLEMTMGHKIQFPIEMSMPWILTDHILETKEASMMEYILYPLDLYNDSAQYALLKFKKQFLYDEVEAEVNLCFDMLVYKLSDQIFAYYKQLAASIMLDKKFYAEAKRQNLKVNYPPSNRYQTLLKLRHMQLLGRSIDLNSLISSMVNGLIQKSLDVAITRFEAGDITGIMELEGLLEVNRRAHKLMSEHLSLTDFDAMLLEANNNVIETQGKNIRRITLQVFLEIKSDLLPNYCYNSSTCRFVKGVLEFETVKREKLPQMSVQYVWGTKDLNRSFKLIYGLYSGFIGAPHFGAMYRLLGYQGIATVISLLLEIVESLLKGTTLEYVKTIMNVMPPQMKLPLFNYGSPGILGFYQLNLVDLISYSDLKTMVFNDFNQIGNAILCCMLIEQALFQDELCDLKQAAPFLNHIPRPIKPKDEEKKVDVQAQAVINHLEKYFSNLNVVTVVEKQGTQNQAKVATDVIELTKERLCRGLTIFEYFLKRIKTFLVDPLWRGEPPANGVMNVDRCDEFHRIWSACQFVYCIPTGEHDFNVEALFGDGLNWAGCTIITLLGQQRRFEALDFSYHLLKVNRIDMKDENKGIPLKKMADRIRKFQIVNNQIFDVLNRHLSSGENGDHEPATEHIQLFQPPVHPSLAVAT